MIFSFSFVSVNKYVYFCSLVMRTQGSLRVVLNTKIWAAMTVERASQKSIRITAVDSDDGSVRVYLIMVSWIVMFTLHEYK